MMSRKPPVKRTMQPSHVVPVTWQDVEGERAMEPGELITEETIGTPATITFDGQEIGGSISLAEFNAQQVSFTPIWYELVLIVGYRSNAQSTTVHVSKSVDLLKGAAQNRAGHTLNWLADGDTFLCPVGSDRSYRIRPLIEGFVVE